MYKKKQTNSSTSRKTMMGVKEGTTQFEIKASDTMHSKGGHKYFNVTVSHTHANKDILDLLTQGVIDNSHTHTNKTILDGILSAPASAADLSSEISARTSSEAAMNTTITGHANSLTTLNSYMPATVSASNKLADNNSVDSKISTLSGKLLDSVATKADLPTASLVKNDTCCVMADESHSNQCWMYQYNGSSWAAKYMVSNTPFTPTQDAAINSGITSAIVGKLSGLPSTTATETLTFTLTDGTTQTKTFVVKGA